MKRVVLDTNVYVDWFRAGLHERWVVGGIDTGRLVRHASAVVLMELAAGATHARAQREIASLAQMFKRLDRLVLPPFDAWLRAGAVLRQLRASGIEARRASLVNDVLIALSVKAVGATLVTRDVADHIAIHEIVRHSFVGISDNDN